jgi:uncharacterized protein (TIGR03083 family)
VKSPAGIDVVDRFPPLRKHLLELFAGLSEEDWVRPTAALRWSVKDVASHLLGGDVWVLSGKRYGFRVQREFTNLVDQVNGLNEEWVLANRRLSARLLREFPAFTGPQVEAYFSSMDPAAMGEPVSWAGPDAAPVWFDLAREFTERWHHQRQIRDATGKPPLYDTYFLTPVLDTFVRALPYNFRETKATEGTVVRFEISGQAGGVWFLTRTGQAWELSVESEGGAAADVVLPQDTAWRMFTKGVDAGRARAASVVRGNASLAAPIFRTISVIG